MCGLYVDYVKTTWNCATVVLFVLYVVSVFPSREVQERSFSKV
jgi:hypothetical protein